MLTDQNDPVVQPMIARIKAIVMTPKTEWPLIAREADPAGEVFIRYVMPLAAIGPVCACIGSGFRNFGLAIASYLITLAGVFVMTFIVAFLAPKFDGQARWSSAFKLVAYSGTAGWLAGVFNIIPGLGILSILGLYGLYLLYVGTGPMLNIPESKRLVFTIVLLVCLLVLGAAMGAVLGALLVGSGGTIAA